MAMVDLGRSNEALGKSLKRLSSGKRINSSADDAGGLAVALKMDSKITRNQATRNNVSNALSLLQAQDAALQHSGECLARMAELHAMAQDVTKSSGDVETYSKEFIELQRQLGEMAGADFNGISLFSTSSTSRTLYTNPDMLAANGSMSIGVINLKETFGTGGLKPIQYYDEGPSPWDPWQLPNYTTDPTNAIRKVSTADIEDWNELVTDPSSNAYMPSAVLPLYEVVGANLGNVGGENSTHSSTHVSLFTPDGHVSGIRFITAEQFSSAIENLADARAENGALQACLNMTAESLMHYEHSMMAAHGRIMDSNVASESTRFARQNVLTQAAAAMAAQANQLGDIGLGLLV